MIPHLPTSVLAATCCMAPPHRIFLQNLSHLGAKKLDTETAGGKTSPTQCSVNSTYYYISIQTKI